MAGDEHSDRRLLVTLIDQYAVTEPSSVWGVMPLDEQDLSKGFRDITYENFANAINIAASWLQENVPPPSCDFQTIAYVGPKDVRYPIIAVAAAKLKKKVGVFRSNVSNADSLSCFYPHPSLLQVLKRILLAPQNVKSIFTAHHSALKSLRCCQTTQCSPGGYPHFPTYYGSLLYRTSRTA